MEKGTGYLQMRPGSTLYQFCDFMQDFLNSLCLYFLFSKNGNDESTYSTSAWGWVNNAQKELWRVPSTLERFDECE